MKNKPKLSATELVEKMKTNGITFDIMNEDAAIEYFNTHNNYFRLASYRKNYDKYFKGDNAGKYIDLDFAYLLELSTIDMHLRFLIIKMCLDIEHSLKVSLLTDISANDKEDGYCIVKDFIAKNEWLLKDIYLKRYSTYVGDLINKYFSFTSDTYTLNTVDIHCPVWAFTEIITFGEFIKFYDFYYEYYSVNKNVIGILNAVKSLRNACAHNNCIIHNLRKGSTRPPKMLSDFIISIDTISKSERQSKLKIRPLFEIVSLICLYDHVVFEPVKSHRYEELRELINNRMLKHADYFKNQQIITASYNFLKKVVDFLP